MANLVNQTAVLEEIERQFRLNFKYSPEVEDAFAVCLIILGTIFLLLGTRLFKWCLFLFTMVGVGGITYFIIVVIWHDSTKALIIGCVFGVIAAIVVFKIWTLSLFLIGVGGGFVVWMVLKALFPTLLTNDIILYATLIVPCIILGIIAVRLEKVWLLLATPLVGSFFMVAGIDHFAHTRLYVFETLKGERNCSDDGGDSCYWMYAAVIGLAIIGFLIQWRITSGLVKGDDKKDFSKLDEREAALELQEKEYEARMKRLERREQRRARGPRNKKGMQRLPSTSMSRSELGHDEP